MKLKDYCKDHVIPIVLYFASSVYIAFLLYGYYVPVLLCIQVFLVMLTVGFAIFFFNYYRSARFFKDLHQRLNKLDQKYLVCELVEEPTFHELREIYEVLYEVNKSMNDHIHEYEMMIKDFKEYIELWIHEVKIPLAAAELMIENGVNANDVSLVEELDKVKALVEQVLFYIRSENVEKDYLIKSSNLKDIVAQVIRTHRKSFIYKKIRLDMDIEDTMVKTDAKWMEFVVGQIVANGIKYANKQDACIHIGVKQKDNQTILYIEDNGIGIDAQDIKRVFEKGFTGENGRKQYNSTGMGLYLCKSLCDKMNHEITISSKRLEGTIVEIIFPEYKGMNMMKH